MDLREALLAEHSRDQAHLICEYIGEDRERFAELVKLMTGHVYRISQRAAWPVSLCVERHPHLVGPHLNSFIKELERSDAHVAVRRNVARLFQFIDIPTRYQGRVFDACYNLLNDPEQPVAVRASSLTVAANLARNEKELLNELKLVATKYPSLVTAGLRSRMKRIFRDI